MERILLSDEGSFLITGYRGVGKTSFVNQVIHKLKEAALWASPLLGAYDIVDIRLNVARPLQPAELMHHIIRRLYDRLVELGIYAQLQPDSRTHLAQAYNRTSFNMTRKLAEVSERAFGFSEASIGSDFLKATSRHP